ncbi:solute carrier family 22 member 15 [Hemiscyllium ocellatum]|uniref:solute carrier family 22 member 15 n=1 Tax=Hemiscyllium ocellatum TaxID=170820 RepID=UPI002966BF94|nr:solute carrier family 22 member 15 [Hemiscyllium ocellatum]
MDVDGALVSVGEFGRYQKQLTVTFVLLQIYVACQSMLIVLVGAQPEYSVNTQEVISTHEELIKHVVFEEDITSIATEWHLIRQEAYKVNLAGSLFFVGLLIGNILFGPLSDRFGRKPIFLTGLFLDVVFGFITAVAPNYEVFAVTRLLVGLVNGGMSLVAFVLTQEFVGKSYWALTGSLTNLVFAVGIVAFSVIGYYIRNWRTLAAVANCPGVLFFLLFIPIPESPRWLYSHGKTEEAEEVLQYIAQRNGNEKIFVQLKPCAGTSKTGQSAHGVMDLVKYPKLRWRTAILMYVWYVCSLVYYGLTLNAGDLKGNRYLNIALYGLVEVPAFPLCLYFIDKSWSGRRKTMTAFLLFAGLACISTMFLPRHLAGFDMGFLLNVTSLALCGKLAVSAAFNIVYVFTAELYPTVIRNAGLGICSMSCRVGGILAPFVPALKSLNPSMPFIVFGIAGMSAGFLGLLLPETLNKPIAESIEDLHTPTYQKLEDKRKKGVGSQNVTQS